MFSEQRTGLLKPYLVRDNNSDTLELALLDVIAYSKCHNKTMLTLRFDAGSVMNSAQVVTMLRSYRVTPAPAAPEHQEQDFAERDVQTVRKRMAANFADQLLLAGTQLLGTQHEGSVHSDKFIP